VAHIESDKKEVSVIYVPIFSVGGDVWMFCGMAGYEILNPLSVNPIFNLVH
jgi:hypothetical protein